MVHFCLEKICSIHFVQYFFFFFYSFSCYTLNVSSLHVWPSLRVYKLHVCDWCKRNSENFVKAILFDSAESSWSFYPAPAISSRSFVFRLFQASPSHLQPFTAIPAISSDIPVRYRLFQQIIANSNQFQPLPAHSGLFQPIQAYSSLFQPSIANASLFKPIQAYSSLFQPTPSYSSIFQPLQAPSSPFKPFPVHSWKFQPIPAYSMLFHAIQAYSSIFQHSPAYSTLFKPIPAYLIFPSFHHPIFHKSIIWIITPP